MAFNFKDISAQSTWIDLDFTGFTSGAYGNYTETITVNGESASIILTDVNKNPTGGGAGISSTGFFQFRNSVPSIIEFPEVPNVGSIRMVFEAFGAGRSNQLQVWNSETSSWDLVQTNSGIGTTGVEFIVNVNIDEPRRYRITSASHAQKIHDFRITQFTADPVLSVIPANLTNLNYTVGFGPSSSQSFELTGTNLNGSDVVVTAPANFEVSKTEVGTYGSSVTLTSYDGTSETVFVRLIGGLGISTYSGNISITGGGSDSKTVSLSGQVTPNYDYIEGFNQFPETSATYNTGSFEGVADNTWNYVNARGTPTISGRSPGLQNNTGASLNSVISGGISTFSFDYMQMFGTNVNLQVFINGDLVTTVTSSGEQNVVKNSGLIHVSNVGDFEIEFKQGTSPLGGQVVIDNFSWISLEGGTATLTGEEGYRLLSSPVPTTLESLLKSNNIFTQCFTGADYTGTACDSPGFGPNVFFFVNGSYQAATNITNAVPAATGVLVYVYGKNNPSDENPQWDKTIAVSGATHTLPQSPTLNSSVDGFTLLGNPSISTIDFNEITRSNVKGVVYVWDVNNEDGIRRSEDEDAGAGSWITYSVGGAGDLEDGLIAPFQGFFVENDGASPTLTIDSDAVSGTGSFRGKDREPLVVRLTLTGEGMSNSTWLSFDAKASTGADHADALQLEPLSSNFAVISTQDTEGRALDINNLPILDEGIELPLIVRTSQSGTYTIALSRMNLPANFSLYLRDNELGVTRIIEDNFEYTFSLDNAFATKSANNINAPTPLVASESEKRFTLVVGPISITSVDGIQSDLPTELTLSQNFPNPFNPTSRIDYQLPAESYVRLSVFDLLGREVAVLVNDRMAPGSHFVNFDASSLSSGVYMYRLQSGGQVITRKMTLIK